MGKRTETELRLQFKDKRHKAKELGPQRRSGVSHFGRNWPVDADGS
jgi:hypothetical protein